MDPHDPELFRQLNIRADRIEELEKEVERLRYVLEGVRRAIDTGRNEPLVIWREQIDIAFDALNGEG